MRKIINGKKYDSESAQECGFWENGENGFDHYREVLYKKRIGEFFLYGTGGCRTKYGESHGGWLTSGERITPLTETEAKKWSEIHLDGDRYEQTFGTVEE